MIWLRSLLNPYVILGVAIACLFGLWKWEKRKTTALKTEAAALQKSVNMAEIELQNAEAINKSALDAVAQQAREVERQKLIAAAEAKKSRERLNAFNALNRKIGNVPTSENVPVSNHLELLLDSERMRGPVAGDGPRPDSSDEGVNGDNSGSVGHDLPPETAPSS